MTCRPPDESLYTSRPIQVFCAARLDQSPHGSQKRCGEPMRDHPWNADLMVCRYGHRISKAEFARRVERKRTGR